MDYQQMKNQFPLRDNKTPRDESFSPDIKPKISANDISAFADDSVNDRPSNTDMSRNN